MKRTVILPLVILMACNARPTDNKTAGTVPPAVTKTDSSAQPLSITTADTIRLKDVDLNEQSIFDKKRIAALRIISPADAKTLRIHSLDETQSADFKYYVLDTLYSGPKANIVVILRAYNEENIARLVVYDDDQKLIDSKQVYYDNAEGFLSVSTKIRQSSIVINTVNDFAEGNESKEQSTVYAIGKGNKFLKK